MLSPDSWMAAGSKEDFRSKVIKRLLDSLDFKLKIEGPLILSMNEMEDGTIFLCPQI